MQGWGCGSVAEESTSNEGAEINTVTPALSNRRELPPAPGVARPQGSVLLSWCGV